MTTATMVEPESVAEKAEVPEGFAKKVAGSFFVFIKPSWDPDLKGRGLFAVRSDGTLLSTDRSDFGFGDPERFGYASPALGSWRKTGDRSIATTALTMEYDGKGAPKKLIKWTGTASFDKDFDSFSGDAFIEGFNFFDDPLDPATEPIDKRFKAATLQGKRIRAA